MGDFMNLCLAVILSAFLSTSFAQTAPHEDMEESTTETTVTTKDVKPAAKMPKMMKTTKTVKTVKTVGLMKRALTCESNGKILNEGDGGYKECMRQVKTKKY
jgi:ABC-type transporter MlaC component